MLGSPSLMAAARRPVVVPDGSQESASPQFDADTFRRQKLDHLLEDEVASMMGTAVKTLRNWRSAGVGPPGPQFGRQVMYPISGIESCLEENLNATSSEERTVGVSVRHQRPTSGLKSDRLGGHRTKQEKSRAA